MIDNKLTNDIEAFLMKDSPTDTDIINGAGLLLRINRNRALHQTIIRRPQRMLPKLTYELNKHLRYRKDGLTLQAVRDLQKKVITEVQEILDAGEPETDDDSEAENSKSAEPTTQSSKTTIQNSKRGKRPDHDSLPDDIKALWDNNAERYKRMKATFETCKALDEPCDRYEYLLQLKEAYEAYKVDMATYDSYDPNAQPEEPQSEEPQPEEASAVSDGTTVVADNAKTIGNARAYISRNRDKYVTLSTSDDTDKAAELKQKIQERVNALVACNATIDEDTAKWLIDNGFTLS